MAKYHMALIHDILYPNGDREHEWSADTLDQIADVVARYYAGEED